MDKTDPDAIQAFARLMTEAFFEEEGEGAPESLIRAAERVGVRHTPAIAEPAVLRVTVTRTTVVERITRRG